MPAPHAKKCGKTRNTPADCVHQDYRCTAEPAMVSGRQRYCSANLLESKYEILAGRFSRTWQQIGILAPLQMCRSHSLFEPEASEKQSNLGHAAWFGNR